MRGALDRNYLLAGSPADRFKQGQVLFSFSPIQKIHDVVAFWVICFFRYPSIVFFKDMSEFRNPVRESAEQRLIAYSTLPQRKEQTCNACA
jgi:hypothetical protein